MKNIPHDIARLIAASILEQPLGDIEQQQLDVWLQASENNRRLYERIQNLESTRHFQQLEQENYGQKMADRFMKRIHPSAGVHTRQRNLYAWIAGAAAVALLALSFVWYRNYQPQPLPVTEVTAFAIQPGKTGAVLTLANGTSVQLQEDSKQVEQLIDSLYNKVENHTPEPDKPEYHTLFIPAGEEYFCQLDDHTSVWLNSQTELRFPKKFTSNERKVYLKGEAFFDVTSETKRPFIVSMTHGDITVYGTRFNVTNYEEAPLSAVLVEGSIGFTTPQGEETKIQPSEKLTYKQQNGHIRVETVDTSLYTAWVEKRFVFNGQPLEEIMTTLSRWYNFNVTFASDKLRHIRLSGQLNRHDDIRILLESYEETTGLRFEITDRNIFITNQK